MQPARWRLQRAHCPGAPAVPLPCADRHLLCFAAACCCRFDPSEIIEVLIVWHHSQQHLALAAAWGGRSRFAAIARQRTWRQLVAQREAQQQAGGGLSMLLLAVLCLQVYVRATGGEIGAASSLAPKIGPLGLSPKKVRRQTVAWGPAAGCRSSGSGSQLQRRAAMAAAHGHAAINLQRPPRARLGACSACDGVGQTCGAQLRRTSSAVQRAPAVRRGSAVPPPPSCRLVRTLPKRRPRSGRGCA